MSFTDSVDNRVERWVEYNLDVSSSVDDYLGGNLDDKLQSALEDIDLEDKVTSVINNLDLVVSVR
jgi:hypothetical protein